MTANDKQVGGDHYKSSIQHWDYVAANELDYFQAMITRYVGRHKKKNGLEDLEKAKHFLDKYIEVVKNKNPTDEMIAEVANEFRRRVSRRTTHPAQQGKTEHPAPFGYEGED